ncbi:hypothetical protein X728_04000 [Mesorhizobium sp. L103C120A0]|nr:hypothetical protein X728_04000 [Mesorhizobium sp. L103C120A0]
MLETTETVHSGLTGETHQVNQLDIILTKLVVMAKNGDLASVDRVLDRLGGKPEQMSKTVNLNIETKPDELEKLTDDQIARMAAIARESSDA